MIANVFLPGFDAYGKGDAAADFQREFAREPKIRCVGVWDTVGALGAPSAEFRWLLDKIFRTDFHSQDLHPAVEYGYHALAIDDMRLTFHPVLWDEQQADGGKPRANTIEQVWFAGAHSNVGGGYPKQGMAHVSLLWMMRKAGALGLRFNDRALAQVAEQANVTDKLYDPRAGAGAYYRYRPRDIDRYAKQFCGGTTKVHASVFHRIASGVEDYAPFNLPPKFDVVDEAGAQTGDHWRRHVCKVIANSQLAALQPRVDRMVALRRVLYAAMWICTVLLALGVTSSSFVLASVMFWFWQLPIPQTESIVAFADRAKELGVALVPLSCQRLIAPAAEFVGEHPYDLPLITLTLGCLYVARSALEARMQAPFVEFWSSLRMQLIDESPAEIPASSRVQSERPVRDNAADC
jgi:hypothetical protein